MKTRMNFAPIAYAIFSVAAAASSGCGAIAPILPDAIRSEVEHISHPLAGWPVSAKDTEDSLSTLNVVGRWTRGNFYVENGVGYKLTDGGFYGPKVTFVSRVGYEWKLR